VESEADAARPTAAANRRTFILNPLGGTNLGIVADE
jgi:hypothetical protein